MNQAPIRLDLFDNSDFDRGASPGLEALWLVCQGVFFRSWVPWPSKFRAWLLRFFGAEVGTNVVIRSGVQVKFPWRLTIGDDVWIGEDVRILNLAEVHLQDHVCLSQETFLCTGSHDFRRPDFPLITKPIHVGPHSWLAARSFVGPGVSIGAQCLVLAGTMIAKDLPDRYEARGNPAQITPLHYRASP